MILNGRSVCEAFKNGMKDYLFGKPSQEYEHSFHEIVVTEKNIFSFGTSTLFRYKKAKSRLPKIKDITDDNALDVLIRFLSGKGNKDLFSLKYLVLSRLMNESVKSDEDARKWVDRVLEDLIQKKEKDNVTQNLFGL